MTPLDAYQQQLQKGMLSYDAQQEAAIQQLQHIYNALVIKQKWYFLRKPCKGLYLWGEVGRGKTHLMDLFYTHLPVPKIRMHFYEFMRTIHTELNQLQGQANPLNKIVKKIAGKVSVVCLDEFLVHDIGDAMLLAQLLKNLFEKKITLITTANVAPDDLYQNGLQREQFLPAITQINQHLHIFHLHSKCDYRIATAIPTIPKNNLHDNLVFVMSRIQVQHLFAKLTQGKTVHAEKLALHGRLISHKGYTENTIWFDFAAICSTPRSQVDYLHIAQRFSSVLIDNIMPIDRDNDNAARLFIQLIDILYDAGAQLILISETKLGDIYPAGRFLFEFKRTKSRLIALQKKFLTSI